MFFEHPECIVHHYCPNWKKFHRTFLVLNTKTKLKYSLDHVNIYLLTYQFFGCFLWVLLRSYCMLDKNSNLFITLYNVMWVRKEIFNILF